MRGRGLAWGGAVGGAAAVAVLSVDASELGIGSWWPDRERGVVSSVVHLHPSATVSQQSVVHT